LRTSRSARFRRSAPRRALDRLAALVAPVAVVVRDGVDRRVPIEKVVVGDLVRLAAGDQVVADGTVASADGLALDGQLDRGGRLRRAWLGGTGVVGFVRG